MDLRNIPMDLRNIPMDFCFFIYERENFMKQIGEETVLISHSIPKLWNLEIYCIRDTGCLIGNICDVRWTID